MNNGDKKTFMGFKDIIKDYEDGYTSLRHIIGY